MDEGRHVMSTSCGCTHSTRTVRHTHDRWLLTFLSGVFHSLSMHLQCLYMAPVVIIPRILLLQPREQEDYKRHSLLSV